MTKLYPLASYNARIVMVSSVFGIRGMFQINANPNKHDGLNDVEQIGVKGRDYFNPSLIQRHHNFCSNSNNKKLITLECFEQTIHYEQSTLIELYMLLYSELITKYF